MALEIWMAAGDETGGWDIVDGRFRTESTGLAWVLGPASVWEKALQMKCGDATALEVFSRPFESRLPDGFRIPKNSAKYHLMDVWAYCKKAGLNRDIAPDVVQDDPVLELFRSDAEWLLRRSGLGVLAVGGSGADGKAAGLGLSGDGLRERARAFAGLMTLALPFLPGDASLNLLAEGRTEEVIADAVRFNHFSEDPNDTRSGEPYRDFIGHLTEGLARASERCQAVVAEGAVISQFHCKGHKGMERLLAGLRGLPFMRSHAGDVVKAMNGIADLAAALTPRTESGNCRLVAPGGFSTNLWSGNYRELRDAIHA